MSYQVGEGNSTFEDDHLIRFHLHLLRAASLFLGVDQLSLLRSFKLLFNLQLDLIDDMLKLALSIAEVYLGSQAEMLQCEPVIDSRGEFLEGDRP